jgi:hypothetical protein
MAGELMVHTTTSNKKVVFAQIHQVGGGKREGGSKEEGEGREREGRGRGSELRVNDWEGSERHVMARELRVHHNLKQEGGLCPDPPGRRREEREGVKVGGEEREREQTPRIQLGRFRELPEN